MAAPRIGRRNTGAAGPPSLTGLSPGQLFYNAIDKKLYFVLGDASDVATGFAVIGGEGTFALLNGPTFTGVPAAPTAALGTSTTQIATTAFVAAALSALLAGAPAALDTLKELADAINDDVNYAATVTAALALKAPIADPTFTGVPKGPTAAAGTSTTQLATCAFVQNAISAATSVDGGTY